jgi:hypothetical protein
LSDFLIDCRFDDVACNLTRDFIWSFDKQLGNCYTYNTGYDASTIANNSLPPLVATIPLKQSIQSGNTNRLGLRLTLFDSLPLPLARIVSQQGNGFVVKLNNNSYAVGGNNQVDLLASLQNNVEMERVYTRQLATPYSSCLINELDENTNSFHSDLYDLLSAANIRYRQNDCIDLCKQQYLIQMCNCSVIQLSDFISLFTNVTICNTPSGLLCASNVFYTQLVSPEFLKVYF